MDAYRHTAGDKLYIIIVFCNVLLSNSTNWTTNQSTVIGDDKIVLIRNDFFLITVVVKRML
jgi:hypothetical protein